MNELDVFLRDRTYQIPGTRTKFCQLRAVFLASLTPRRQRDWPRARVLTAIRERFPTGRDSAGTLHVGNLSLSPPAAFVTEGGKLVKV